MPTTGAASESDIRVFDVLIVGAGHGGAQAAIALRQRKFEGSIAIIGDETSPPYERPPLSKEYLAAEKDFDRILIRPLSFWADRAVHLMTGRRVVEVDPGAHTVKTQDGATIGYRKLIWSAGGRPRMLSCAGSDLAGVHTMRTREDADRLAAELPDVRNVVVIGAGYIGLEAAAVLNKLGKQVVVLEAQGRVLARVAGQALSDFLLRVHREHGVEIRLGCGVEGLEGTDGRVCGVRLTDGQRLPADVVIVGIGISPAVEPLLAAGAEGGNGVRVDDQCRTSLPDVYAIGDCALHDNVHAGGSAIRLESVQNANDMAAAVAVSIIGNPEPYAAVPWFWSNQYDLKLQTVGLGQGFDEEVVRGEPSSGSFSVAYLKNGRVLALDCVNAVKDYVQGRKLVQAKPLVDRSRLADPSIALKDLMEEAPA